MSNHYAYKPRFGFDIRIKPPRQEDAPIWEASARRCDAPGCARRADCRAPKSPDNMSDFYWFCTEHARDYNRCWNFFDGMSEAEAAAFREAAIYGHRPTWKMSVNSPGAGAAASHASFRGRAAFEDAFGVFGRVAPTPETGPWRRDRKLTRLQEKALASLDLAADADGPAIRARYKLLVKRFHPDANGGDRSTEARFRDVLRAYQILRRANFC